MSEFAVHSDNPNITGTHKNFRKDVAAHMLSVPLPPTLGKRYRDADRKFLIKPLKETKKYYFFLDSCSNQSCIMRAVTNRV